MKRIFLYIFFFSAKFCLAQSSINDLSYLLGQWQIINPKEHKISTETWSFEEDHYVGHSITHTKGKITFEENMKIYLENKRLVYAVNTPENLDWVYFTQNEHKAKNKIVFENKEHDFPKYISYQSKTINTVYAEVGDYDKVKLPFHYTKVQKDSIKILAVLSKMQLQYHLNNMNAVASHYDTQGKIVAFNTYVEGLPAIKKYWSTFSPGNWKLESDWLQVKGNIAVQRGRSKITYPDDKAPDAVEFLINWTKKKGVWYIAQDAYW